MNPISAEQRALAREMIASGTFDVLIIGGGIVGLATGWLAGRAGLRVAVVDRGDFAGATSSASTKLVHGGLRYLQQGSVGLIYENHKERRALGDRLAPHIVHPLPFLVPLYRNGPHGPLKIGAGMLAYSALSVFSDGVGRVVFPKHASELVPSLRPDGLRACGLYHDHQMNDSRLAIATARAASNYGATLLNHAEVVGLRIHGGRIVGAELQDRLDGSQFSISSRVVVNAAGPWLDDIRRLENPSAGPSIRLSKGAHLVLRAQREWHAALTIPLDAVRVSFAIPWEGRLLLGTTDEQYEGDPAAVACTEKDVAQILGEAGHAVEADQLDPANIVYRFAGLRVLPGGGGTTAEAKRETVISRSPGGMLSVAGGKWTTFRRIGSQVLSQILNALQLPSVPGRTEPLPGAGTPGAIARLVHTTVPDLADDIVEHLVRHYGTLSYDLLALVAQDPGLRARIHPDGPDIWAQVKFGIEQEWACTEEDILRRRTTVMVRGLDTPEARAKVKEFLETTADSRLSRL